MAQILGTIAEEGNGAAQFLGRMGEGKAQAVDRTVEHVSGNYIVQTSDRAVGGKALILGTISQGMVQTVDRMVAHASGMDYMVSR